MKPQVICWIAQRFYENHEIVDLLVAHNICPLLDSSYAVGIWERLGKPEVMSLFEYGTEYKQQKYFDEIFSNKKISKQFTYNNNKGLENCLTAYPDLTIGETCTEYIQQLVDAGCKSITLTSYGLHLFRLFGINFRLDCISQIYTWDRIMKKHPGKFHFNWLMIDQLGRAPKLIEWCKRNGNTMGLVCPDSWNKEMSVEEMYNKLSIFIKALEK